MNTDPKEEIKWYISHAGNIIFYKGTFTFFNVFIITEDVILLDKQKWIVDLFPNNVIIQDNE